MIDATAVPRRHRHAIGAQLAASILGYSHTIRPLPGVEAPGALDCLVRQFIDSIRRVEYVKRLAMIAHNPAVIDPTSSRFDPLKAAVVQSRQRNTDDAVWLVFLAVHFGKHGKDGWELARRVYGRAGEQGNWDWAAVSADVPGFRSWLEEQGGALASFRFSNHRKYESLHAHSTNGTGSVVESFVAWMRSEGSFDGLIRAAHQRTGQNPEEVFDLLYKSLRSVRRFGRLAKFDFLTMLSKLGIAPISPGSAFIGDNATGPYQGIRLLLTGERDGSLSRAQADAAAVDIADHIGVGMQEFEDAVCNWQKSPLEYRHFRG